MIWESTGSRYEGRIAKKGQNQNEDSGTIKTADVVHNDTESNHAIIYKEMLSESLYLLSGENFRDLK